MKRRIPQFSAGGVLVRTHEQELQACLIKRCRYQQETWCIPKGHLEAGESAENAAIREIAEETGATAEIVKLLGEIHYRFSIPGKNREYDKTVTFFLMKSLTTKLRPQDTLEVVEARWFNFESALDLISYDNERNILRQARDELSKSDVLARISD